MSPSKSNRYTSLLNQTVVYWSTPVSDGAGGKTFATPVELSVRWEDKQELYMDEAGQEHRSSSVVYVSQDMDKGGYLFLGDLDDLSSGEGGDPLTVANAFEIRFISKSPDRNADSFIRKVLL